MSVEGKITIISGASGGVGQTVSRVFHQAGASVALLGTHEAGVQALAEELGQDRTLPVVANLADSSDAEAVVRTVVKHFGRVDLLLNLVGGFTGGRPVSESDGDDLKRMLEINLWTTYNLCRAAVKPMIDQNWGRIVNTGSRDSLQGRANYSAYAISKAAVLRLTESMAEEVRPYDITVNAILPGMIDTEANRQALPEDDHSKWVKPNTIAETLLFLSQCNTAINGAAIPVYEQA
jgi:NAD(P)-dependent dehydrogenase (short-subunit alcohol dehydrogenase family)